MAYAFVQSTSKQSSGVASDTLAYTSNVTAGALLAAVVSWWSPANGITAVSWAVGGSATPVLAVENLVLDPGSHNNKAAIYYAPNASAGAHTFQVDFAGAVDVSVAVHEYSGIATTTPLDQTATAMTNATTSASSGTTATLAQTDNLVFGMTNHDTSGTIDITSSDVTIREEQQNNSTSECVGTGDKRVTATTGVSVTFGYGTAVDGAKVLAAVFKEAAGGAVAAPRGLLRLGVG